ncbi:GtrA family protein [Auraticoccus sp. F435]|uniref:GtrA family protein n=1 Tax=Auraticoccus cholistanensis TaxID=2656650 RepID=A0A6A9V1Y9_9ACTN|nr:GtrA family protein [Auraticoccus cholistanensis]MVA77612.1 GtrA family protein [Auraticoccus cholistanensis]
MTRASSLGREVVRFAVVGGLTYLVDVGLSNLLLYGAGPVPAPLAEAPLPARATAFLVAMALAWLGNLLWTYGERRTGSPVGSAARYLVVNLVSMLVVLLPTGVTWYLLGLRDPLSYNIATNVVGFALATAFRFWAYRSWVFRPVAEPVAPQPGSDAR